MQVNTTEIEYCKLKVNYKADSEVVRAKYDDAVAELRHLQIPGFRKGRAPDYAIRARCKDRIRNWVTKEMAAQAYDDMVFETHAKPIGYPQFEDVTLTNTDYECEMTVLKKPEFELKPYTEYEIPKPDVDQDTTAETEKALQDLRMRFGDVEPYGDDDFVTEGDQITMDFVATIDDKPFDGSVAEGKLYTVGENPISKEFDDSLLGMMPGDEREFDIKMPEHFEEVGGKTAKFKVTVHMGTKRKPAELTDEMAKQCGVEDMTQLRQRLEIIAKRRIDQKVAQALQQQVCRRLVSDNNFEVPGFLGDNEAQMIAARAGVPWGKLTDEQREELLKQAQDNVRLSLILDSVRDEEPDAVLSDGEAQQALANQFATHGKDPKEAIEKAQKDGSILGMISGMRDEFTLQWLVSKAKIME
jgi:trigger factor